MNYEGADFLKVNTVAAIYCKYQYESGVRHFTAMLMLFNMDQYNP